MVDGRRALVVLVEDHAVLSQGLAMVLRQEGFEVATIDTNGLTGPQVLERLADPVPDLVVFDLDLGDAGDARSLIPATKGSGTPVVVLTGEDDPAVLGECLETGACAVLGKSSPLEEVLATVRKAVAGDPAMPAGRREDLLAATRERRSGDRQRLAPFRALTPREEEVLAALLAGRSAREVAETSYVSLATVRSQINSIFRKLGVNTQVQALVLAREAGWQPRR